MLRFVTYTFVALFTTAALAECEPYLVRNPDGTDVGVYRIESINGRNVALYDVSDYVREIRLPSDNRINVFKLDALFAAGKVFLGFGYPNVFVGFPPDVNGTDGWTKFAAKSFRRADTTLDETRGFAQSGLLAVLKDLTPEQGARLHAAARNHLGRRGWTCVNLNGCMLAEAGITVGGESPASYYLPGALLKAVLTYGLEMDGRPLALDIVRVNPMFLERIKLGIDRAVGTTLCRHGERACAIKKTDAGRWTAPLKRLGQRAMKVVLGAPRSPRDRAPLEASVVRMPSDGRTYDLRASQPSGIGVPLRWLWGTHTLFEVSLPKDLVDRHLPTVLRAFPNPKPDWVTRIKKTILFSPPVVAMLRGHVANQFQEFANVSTSNLYGMMRTDSPSHPNKYNLVILGDRAVVMKIRIKMRSVDWILSKHLILSGYSPDVRFAAEFMKAENGDIVLNRNSGTYQPTPELLARAQQLLAEVFPGVNIVTVDNLP